MLDDHDRVDNVLSDRSSDIIFVIQYLCNFCKILGTAGRTKTGHESCSPRKHSNIPDSSG